MAHSTNDHQSKADGSRLKRLKPSSTSNQRAQPTNQRVDKCADRAADRGRDRGSVPAGRAGSVRYGPLPSPEAFRVVARLTRFLADREGRLADLAGRVRVDYVPPQPSLLRLVTVDFEALSEPEAARLTDALLEPARSA